MSASTYIAKEFSAVTTRELIMVSIPRIYGFRLLLNKINKSPITSPLNVAGNTQRTVVSENPYVIICPRNAPTNPTAPAQTGPKTTATIIIGSPLNEILSVPPKGALIENAKKSSPT